MAVSVAILYAGRWFGRAGQHLEEEDIPGNDTPNALRASWQWCLQTSGAPATAGADDEPSLAAEEAQMLGPGGATHTATPGTQRLLRAAQRAAQRAAVDAGGKAGRAIVREIAHDAALHAAVRTAKAEEVRRRSGRTHDMKACAAPALRVCSN